MDLLPCSSRPVARAATPAARRGHRIVTAVAAPDRATGSTGEVAQVPEGLNKYSSRITQPKSQGASQAMLFATGLTEADMSKPQVGGLFGTFFRGTKRRRLLRDVSHLQSHIAADAAAQWLL